MSAHLSPELIEALLAGRSSADEEGRLAAHLAQGACPTCDAALEVLEPEAERRLIGLLARIEQAGPPPAAVLDGILDAASPQPWFARPWAWGPALAAAAALIAILVWFGPTEPAPGGQRVKGQGVTTGAIELQVGVVSERPEDPVGVRPVRSDEVLAPGQTLVFRVRATTPGCHLYLVQRTGQQDSVLWPTSLSNQRQLPAGDLALQSGGKPLGLSLEGEPGAQSFWAVCSRTAIEDEAGVSGLLPTRGQDLSESDPPDGVSWDRVRVILAAPGEGP